MTNKNMQLLLLGILALMLGSAITSSSIKPVLPVLAAPESYPEDVEIFDSFAEVNYVEGNHYSINLPWEKYRWDRPEDVDTIKQWSQEHSVVLYNPDIDHGELRAMSSLSFTPLNYDKQDTDDNRFLRFGLSFRSYIAPGGAKNTDHSGVMFYNLPMNQDDTGVVYPAFIDGVDFDMELQNAPNPDSEFEIKGATSSWENEYFTNPKKEPYAPAHSWWESNLVTNNRFDYPNNLYGWSINNPGSASFSTPTEARPDIIRPRSNTGGAWTDHVLKIANPTGVDNTYVTTGLQNFLGSYYLTVYYEGYRSGGSGSNVGMELHLTLKDGLRTEYLTLKPSELQLTSEETSWKSHSYVFNTLNDPSSIYYHMHITQYQIFLYNNEACTATFDNIYVGSDYWSFSEDPDNYYTNNLDDWRSVDKAQEEFANEVENYVGPVAEALKAGGWIAKAIKFGAILGGVTLPTWIGPVAGFLGVGAVGLELIRHSVQPDSQDWVRQEFPDDKLSERIYYYGEDSEKFVFDKSKPVVVETDFMLTVSLDDLDYRDDTTFSLSFTPVLGIQEPPYPYTSEYADIERRKGMEVSLDIHLTTTEWVEPSEHYETSFEEGPPLSNGWSVVSAPSSTVFVQDSARVQSGTYAGHHDGSWGSIFRHDKWTLAGTHTSGTLKGWVYNNHYNYYAESTVYFSYLDANNYIALSFYRNYVRLSSMIGGQLTATSTTTQNWNGKWWFFSMTVTDGYMTGWVQTGGSQYTLSPHSWSGVNPLGHVALKSRVGSYGDYWYDDLVILS